MSTYESPRPGSLSARHPVGVHVERGAVRMATDWLRARSARALFLSLALPFGVFLVFAIPPFQGLDEPSHFFRVYSISDGALVAPTAGGDAGAVLPACLPAYAGVLGARAAAPGPLHAGDSFTLPAGCAARPSAFVPFDNTAVYSPVSYVPQVIGVAIARWLGASLPVVFYAGRLFALLAYAGLVFLALSVAPRGRWAILVVALMPMSLVLGTQYSADGMTIAYSLVLVASVIRCLCDPRATWRWFLLVGAAAAALALSKSTYFALTPLLLLVPNRLFPTRWSAVAAKVATLCLVGLLAGLWYLEVRGIAPNGAASGADARLQVQYILHHTGRFAKFVLNTLFGPTTGYFTLQGFVSWVGFSRNSALGTPAPPPLVLAAGIGLVLAAYRMEVAAATISLSRMAVARALLPVTLVAANAVLVVTTLYLTVVPVGAPVLWLQGRYLLPLATVPVISVLALQPPDVRQRPVHPAVPVVLLLILGYLVLKVAVYFY